MAQPPKSETDTSGAPSEDTSSSSPPAQQAEAAPDATEPEGSPGAQDSGDADDADDAPYSPVPIEDAVHPDAPDAANLPSTFEAMGLSEPMLAALAKLGWGAPTKVQAAAFGPVTAGDDVLVQSQTGSGKTGAFCLPWLAARFEPGDAKDTGVQLLVMTPTRELAKQVCDQLIKLAGETPVVPLPVYGGTAIGPQFDALKTGVHAVVGTPGRILDHIRRRTLDLSRVQTVVLDEADEMLSMGFLEDIHAILDACPRERQTTLFSATVPSDIERIARRYMKDPESLKLSGDDIAAAQIEHVYYSVPGTMRPRDLINIVAIEEPGSTLIFCNTREETNLVANVLRREGFSAEALSSDLSQAAREHVLGAMRKGRLRFLVATDVASRGIDITHISHVFNYSFPQNAESYVHRTGRTGRAGRAGKAISLIGPHDMGNFYYLKLAYPSIEFTEASFPDQDELEARRNETKLDQVSKRFPELVSPEWTVLARTLAADPRGEQVIAYLLSEAMSAPDPAMEVARDLPEQGDDEDRGRGPRGRRERTDRDRGRPDRDRDRGGRDRDRGGRDRDRDRDRGRDRDRERDRDSSRRRRDRDDTPEPQGSEDGTTRRRRRRGHSDDETPETVQGATQKDPKDDVDTARGDVVVDAEEQQGDADHADAAKADGAADGEQSGDGRRRRRRRRRRGSGGDEAPGETSTRGQRDSGDREEDDDERGPADLAPAPELAAAANEPEGDAVLHEPGAAPASEAAESDAEDEASEGADTDTEAEAASTSAPCESTEGLRRTHDGASLRGRRRRRRRRRRGGRGKSGDGNDANAEAASTKDSSQRTSDADQGGPSTDAESKDGDGGKRRRRRRRGGRGKKTETVEQHVSQDQIIIDIDENELEVVRDEFGEIDELDDLTLKGRRRGVIDALQDEVELEDLSDEDTPSPQSDESDDEGPSDDDDASDSDNDEGDEGDDEDGDETTSSDDDPKEAKKRKRRRRRKKKKAEAPPPELTAPPHKDFWEVWSAKFTFREFEDDQFRGGTEAIVDEPEPEPESAPERKRKRRSKSGSSSRSDSDANSNSNSNSNSRGTDERDPAKIGNDDGPMVTVSLNVGRAHGKKSAHIRELLASDFGLEGRSVRNLTVKETETEFRVSTQAHEGLEAAVLGYVFDDIELVLTVIEAAPAAEAEAEPDAAARDAVGDDASEPVPDPAVLTAAQGDEDSPQPEV